MRGCCHIEGWVGRDRSIRNRGVDHFFFWAFWSCGPGFFDAGITTPTHPHPRKLKQSPGKTPYRTPRALEAADTQVTEGVVPTTMTPTTHNNAAYSRAPETVMLVIFVDRQRRAVPAKLQLGPYIVGWENGGPLMNHRVPACPRPDCFSSAGLSRLPR